MVRVGSAAWFGRNSCMENRTVQRIATDIARPVLSSTAGLKIHFFAVCNTLFWKSSPSDFSTLRDETLPWAVTVNSTITSPSIYANIMSDGYSGGGISFGSGSLPLVTWGSTKASVTE